MYLTPHHQNQAHAPYADIAVLAPMQTPLTYIVPEGLRGKVKRGARVIVPLGARQLTGYVVNVHHKQPTYPDLRELIELIDDEPQFGESFLEFLLFVADYYLAPPGEVFRSVLPGQLHRTSRPGLMLTEKGVAALQEFRDQFTSGEAPLTPEAILLGAIERDGVMPADEIEDFSHVQGLLSRGLLEKVPILEAAKDKLSTEKWVEKTGVAPKRALSSKQQSLMFLLQSGPRLLRELAGDLSGAREVVKALSQQGLVRTYEKEVTRDPFLSPPKETPIPVLNAAQQAACNAISEKIRSGDYGGFLLHGITGSGKTEVYLHAIAECDRLGRGAIVLVPEISLTPQLANIFRGRFGDKVAILHSALSDNDRFEQWCKIRDGQRTIVVGPRSALFAPMPDVGVIAVDEEHDPSFKQEDRLRYHARDLALVRAKGAAAVAILGSATPSLESHFSPKLTRLLLPERATPKPLPVVEVVDLRKFSGALGDAMLSPPLIDGIAKELELGGQSILFLNRRGFASCVVCQGCGFTFVCKDCDVTLTHHKTQDLLMCHYCNYSHALPQRCPSCAQPKLALIGAGTERVEAKIQEMFPKARVLRLDRDTSSVREMESILHRFSKGEADILIGTQMVSKGHDFSGVSLVGVILADMALRLPDFRASERTFQLLVQVAGRAGRGQRPGRVYLQTFVPEHEAVECAKDHDYFRFAALELERRKARSFPPFAHMVVFRLDGPNPNTVHQAAESLRRRALTLVPRGVEVLGPAPAPISRLKGKVRYQLIARAAHRPTLRSFVKEFLLGARAMIQQPMSLSTDIDPVSMM
jgi:primosomal protein N' (replication factor Y)